MTPGGRAWSGFVRAGALAFGLAFAGLCGVVAVMDPYGVRVRPGRPPTALMDINQRYMYPQLVRSGLFDSAVFGTSTIRLLDPLRLGEALGGRFANLGLNAGTPWEQMEIARLFLRHVPRPRALVFGLDRTWCEPEAESRRLTFRPFPPWLYDESGWNDLPHLASLKSLEIAGRVALHAGGLMAERIRDDGYEVFTPPEATYDLARARLHIHGPADDALALGAPGRGTAARMPALDLLAALVADVPATTRMMLLFPPVHVVSQAAAGTPEAEWDEACKARVAALARDRGAALVDFRFASPITREDSNYWDKLHYRQPVAGTILRALAEAGDAADGPRPDAPYRMLVAPSR